MFAKPVVPLVRDVAEFTATEMSERFSTRRSCQSWLKNHILPKWGECPITDLQALEVRNWLRGLVLTPKSRGHIKALIRQLWSHAMLHLYVDLAVNPMTLVRLKGATKKRKPRSLTVEQFRLFVTHLEEPIRTVALFCACLGLRISECMALKWPDVDWVQRTGGESGIRTHVRVSPKHAFQACAFSHSAISPVRISARTICIGALSMPSWFAKPT